MQSRSTSMSAMIGLPVVATVVLLVMGADSRRTERGAVPPENPGSALTPGTRLTYASGGRDQPAWTVDSVHQDVALGGRTGCTRIHIRMRPDQAAAAPRVVCRGGDTLFAWNAAGNAWRPDRPLGAVMTLSVPQPSGATLDYTTAQHGDTTISGRAFGFVHTVIVTRDAQGKPTRRLRERYSLALATALGGVFEVPDSVVAGVWRESQRFDLVRVEIP